MKQVNMNVDGVDVLIEYADEKDAEIAPVNEDEVKAYINRSTEQKPTKAAQLVGLTLKVEGDDVDISYEYGLEKFERIRRITGYLVGTLDRFNNGKRAEVEDRVKHSIADDCEDVYVDTKPAKASKSKGMEIGD